MESSELNELYGDAILDHCRHPRNRPTLESPRVKARAVNPFCGDEVDLQIAMECGRVSRVGAQGVGCAINQASTSMLSEAIAGKRLDEVAAVAGLFRDMMGGAQLGESDLEDLGDLRSLERVRDFPVRIKCALLAWSALEDGLQDYSKDANHPSGSPSTGPSA